MFVLKKSLWLPTLSRLLEFIYKPLGEIYETLNISGNTSPVKDWKIRNGRDRGKSTALHQKPLPYFQISAIQIMLKHFVWYLSSWHLNTVVPLIYNPMFNESNGFQTLSTADLVCSKEGLHFVKITRFELA